MELGWRGGLAAGMVAGVFIGLVMLLVDRWWRRRALRRAGRLLPIGPASTTPPTTLLPVSTQDWAVVGWALESIPSGDQAEALWQRGAMGDVRRRRFGESTGAGPDAVGWMPAGVAVQDIRVGDRVAMGRQSGTGAALLRPFPTEVSWEG